MSSHYKSKHRIKKMITPNDGITMFGNNGKVSKITGRTITRKEFIDGIKSETFSRKSPCIVDISGKTGYVYDRYLGDKMTYTLYIPFGNKESDVKIYTVQKSRPLNRKTQTI